MALSNLDPAGLAMLALLRDTAQRSALIGFAESRHTEESVLFCIAVEEFRRLPSPMFVCRVAKKLFNTYIAPTAKLQVCCPPDVLQRIELGLTSARYPPSNLFSELEQLVRRELSMDKLQRFLAEQSRRGRQTNLGEGEAVFDGAYLSRVIEDDAVRLDFEAFLEREQSAELLQFVIAAGEFHRLPNQTYINNQAQKLFCRFVEDSGPMQVCLPSGLKEDLGRDMWCPTLSLFNVAQAHVLCEMGATLMPAFLEAHGGAAPAPAAAAGARRSARGAHAEAKFRAASVSQPAPRRPARAAAAAAAAPARRNNGAGAVGKGKGSAAAGGAAPLGKGAVRPPPVGVPSKVKDGLPDFSPMVVPGGGAGSAWSKSSTSSSGNGARAAPAAAAAPPPPSSAGSGRNGREDDLIVPAMFVASSMTGRCLVCNQLVLLDELPDHMDLCSGPT